MRRILAVLGALGVLAATAVPLLNGPAAAATPGVEKTFLIPSSDGYGTADCLSTGSGACGQVVADAWCESQGFAKASAFGLAAQEEYTGAIDTPPVVKAAERPIRITCRD